MKTLLLLIVLMTGTAHADWYRVCQAEGTGDFIYMQKEDANCDPKDVWTVTKQATIAGYRADFKPERKADKYAKEALKEYKCGWVELPAVLVFEERR